MMQTLTLMAVPIKNAEQQQGVTREVKEELDLDSTASKLVGVYPFVNEMPEYVLVLPPSPPAAPAAKPPLAETA